jgi:diadenosine tetraphosphate (Ap4A) HIT family hydrolase
MQIKPFVFGMALFLVGVGCGGYLFSESIPRSFLPSAACGKHCYTEQEIAGLITSAAILHAPFLVPKVVLESDTCLSIRYPKPEPHIKTHYVLFPKHDVKNIAMLTPEDVPYVIGCFAMIHELVSRDKLETYSVVTNGPGKQEIAYLHFHLIAK